MAAVVFGASGCVGLALLKLLSATGVTTRAVSRSGRIASLDASPLPNVTVVAGDALDGERTLELSKGAATIYCCVGLPYDSTVWEQQWPKVVDNLLAAAAASGATLVFADNLYCYGPESAGRPLMEGSSEFTAYGHKPAVRAELNRRMLRAHSEGRAKVGIVRASDFFGPGVANSVVMGSTVLPPVLSGRWGPFGTALFAANARNRHALTYVPDFAAALLAVAGDPGAWGRAWHVPSHCGLTPAQCLERVVELENGRRTVLAAQKKEGDAPRGGGELRPLTARWTEATGVTGRLLRVLVPLLREFVEMSYQWDNDFIVDSGEFEARFPGLGLPTPLDTALLETVDYYKRQAAEQK